MSNIPSTKEIQKWKRDSIIEFLREKKEELDLDDEDINIIRKSKVSGSAFLKLSQEELQRCGLQLGPAKAIVELIKDIKGEQQGNILVYLFSHFVLSFY